MIFLTPQQSFPADQAFNPCFKRRILEEDAQLPNEW